jgi:hypothetical protein
MNQSIVFRYLSSFVYIWLKFYHCLCIFKQVVHDMYNERDFIFVLVKTSRCIGCELFGNNAVYFWCANSCHLHPILVFCSDYLES